MHEWKLYLIVQGSDPDVLEGNDALGDVLSGVLEVVEAPVVQHEPPPLPALPAPSLNKWIDEWKNEYADELMI